MNTADPSVSHRNMFFTVLDIIPLPIYIKDENLKLFFVNNAYAEFLRIKKDDVLGKTAYDLYPSKYADPIDKKDREIIFNNLEMQSCETLIPINSDSGSVDIREVIMNKAAFITHTGARGLIGVIIDISDKQKLKRINKLMNVVFEACPDIIIIHERTRGIVMSNCRDSCPCDMDKCSSMLCESGCIESKKASSCALRDATKRPCPTCKLMDIFNKNMTVDFECMSLVDGRYKRVRGIPITSSSKRHGIHSDIYGGTPVDMVVEYIYDIHNDRVSRYEMEKVFSEFKAVFDNKIIGVAIIKDSKVVSANEKFSNITGFNKCDIIGLDVHSFFKNRKDFNDIKLEFLRVVRENELFDHRIIDVVKKDKSTIRCDVSCNMMTDKLDDGVVLFVYEFNGVCSLL